MLTVLVGAVLLLVTIGALLTLISRNIVRVPPDSALVITGRRMVRIDPETGESRMRGYRVIVGGSAFCVPILERVDRLPLSEMSIRFDGDDLQDLQGAARAVSVLVNCNIASDGELMDRAIRRFLTMELPDVENIVRTTIESRITNAFLATDLSSESGWPEREAGLDAAIREDLEALGVKVDTLVFRRVPVTANVAQTANGRGISRSE